MDLSFEPFVGESAERTGVDATRWEVEQIVSAYIRVVIDLEEFWKAGGCVGSEWRVPNLASARIAALINAGAISQDRIAQLEQAAADREADASPTVMLTPEQRQAAIKALYEQYNAQDIFHDIGINAFLHGHMPKPVSEYTDEELLEAAELTIEEVQEAAEAFRLADLKREEERRLLSTKPDDPDPELRELMELLDDQPPE